MNSRFFVLLLALTAPSLAGCDLVRQTEVEGMLELPSISASDRIIEYEGFTVSYNTENLIPDWVAYELTAEEADHRAEREDTRFSMDMSFDGPQAMREDYSGSGWTKGHMAPAADFLWSDDAREETFYLINICPQKEELNRKDWQYLEKQVRKWAIEYDKVWVVTGPIVGQNRYGTIGEQEVVVPDAFFKTLLVYDGFEYQGVAFVMNNDAGRYYLEKVAMSIDDLEKKTGIDFFPALPDDIEDAAEAAYDPSVWGLRADR